MTPEEKLEWQAELDSAMADIDTRLRHPRRRASDHGPQPTVSDLSQVNLTSELLDEIAWRVTEAIRKQDAATAATAGPVAPAAEATTPNPSADFASEPELEPERPANGAAITIRIRRPLFRPPWRKRTSKQALITFADYRIG